MMNRSVNLKAPLFPSFAPPHQTPLEDTFTEEERSEPRTKRRQLQERTKAATKEQKLSKKRQAANNFHLKKNRGRGSGVSIRGFEMD
jgi:hypothetical protein